MAVYVIFASVGFTTTQRRDRVATRARNAATTNGFTASSRVPGYQPGTVTFNDTTSEPGTTYPSVSICYEHTDQALIAQAEQAIQDEINAQGVVTGNYGTGTDVSG